MRLLVSNPEPGTVNTQPKPESLTLEPSSIPVSLLPLNREPIRRLRAGDRRHDACAGASRGTDKTLNPKP